MLPSSDDIVSLTRDVCDSVLQMPLEVFGDDGPDAERQVLASVQITGDWQGAVAIVCSRHVAASATAAMFGTEPDEVSASDLDDALGEIANMIGGNIKNKLGPGCKLSLPTVVSGDRVVARFPGTRVATDLRFGLPCGPFAVQVLAKAV